MSGKGTAYRIIASGLLGTALFSDWHKDKHVIFAAAEHQTTASTLLTTSSETVEVEETTSSDNVPTSVSSESSSVNSSSQQQSAAESVKTDTTTSSQAQAVEKKELSAKLPATADEEQVEENYQISIVKNVSTSEFIEAIGSQAQAIAAANDLYASVMIAQAILETGSGSSALSQPPNYNLFGIKGSFEGASVTFSTQEDPGTGNLYTIKAAFRKYPSYKESLKDYAELLKQGISGNCNFYAQTWKSNTTHYKEATAFLTGSYATDVYYDKKLNALIEAYQLTQYDGAATSSQNNNQSESTAINGESTDTIEFNMSTDELLSPGRVVPDYAFQTTLPQLEQAINQRAAKDIKGSQPVNRT